MNIFFEIHQDLPREGPGDEQSTCAALALLADLPLRPRILDIGCGPGMQTLLLARQTGGMIVAIDTHQPFLVQLDRCARSAGLSKRLHVVNTSMAAPGFAAQQFDAIWSEGAIYIMGFEQGLRSWRSLLRPGGYIAVSELSWLQPDPPAEVRTFWGTHYPAMQPVAVNLALIRAAGYQSVGHFTLPQHSWWDEYYTPLETRIVMLRDRYRDDPEATQQLNEEQTEIDLYRRYAEWYGYVFYAMKKE